MTNAQPEPSMEEILASIRRIISDDGEEEATAPQTAPPTAPTALRARPTPAPAVAPPSAPVIQAPAQPSFAPRPFVRREEPAVNVSPAAQAAISAPAEEDRAQLHLKTEDIEMIKRNTAEAEVVVDDVAASAAAKAFQSLSQQVRISARSEGGATLEDMVVEMIRPMLKQWLDQNLAKIVEEKVEAEVQRVARMRR
jgi:hypothetical protein